MQNKELQAQTEAQQSTNAELLPSAPLEANPMLGEGLYTKSQIYDAIDFGTDLAQTAGFEEGHDAWIENKMEKFVNSLKPFA